jgi:tripartite-type tricarboxylate transporter receptor subunit TctC
LVLAAIALVAFLSGGCANADGSFFQGKTITITTSAGPGGVHDLVARELALYMGKYLDGHPRFVVQNMPGGGDVVATNYMYAIAPRDGTSIAVVSDSIPLHQVIDGHDAHYDSSKFNWIGSIGPANDVVFAWRSAGVATVVDLEKKGLVLGGTGPGSNLVIIPTVMNNVLGTKFKIVIGYKSSNDLFFAMQRGEIQARDGSYGSVASSYPSWIKDGKIVFLAQDGFVRDKNLRDVPLLIELAKSSEERAVLELISSPAALGEPYLAPPGVPADRLEMLRAAFAETMRDKGFQTDMKKLRLEVDPITGEDLGKIVDKTVGAAPDVIERARSAMTSNPVQ